MLNSGLEVKQLYTDRDDRVLFSDLSFHLNAGQLLQIAGPNGSGKTSLLRILAGLSSRYSGEVLWQGKSLQKNRHDYLQQRRVNLARLFCIPAQLWILDEPFTAIDQGGVCEIEQWLSEFVSGGGSVLLTTHHKLSVSQGFNVITLGASNV